MERTEAEIKKCADEIERKTREQDILNRKLEKILAAVPPGEDAGVVLCNNKVFSIHYFVSAAH